MESFKNLSLDDNSPRNRLHRSMSLSEISPRKEVEVAEKVLSGPSGTAVLRQYSYHEMGVVPGTTSLRYSRKFVSEFHIDLAGANTWPDVPSKKNLVDIASDFNKFVVPDKKPSSQHAETIQINKVEKPRKRSHDSSGASMNFKRKKLFTFTPVSCSIDKIDEGEQTCTTTQLLFVIVPLFLAVIAALGTQYAVYQKTCESLLDINASEYLLSSSIFGQENAVKSIVNTFRQFSSSDKNGLHVMIFSGPTGVGKTYTASLIEEIFPWKHNIHHFIMPIDFEKLSEHSMYNFPYCGDHLVILDDLRMEDIKDVANIVSYLKNLAERNKVIAMLIFKFHKQLSGNISKNEILEMSDEVLTNIIQNGVKDCVLIDFKALKKNDVIQCIKEALTRHWIPISDQAINTILDQVDYHTEGCKRIPSKIAVVNEFWSRQT